MPERYRFVRPNGECKGLIDALGPYYLPRALLEQFRPHPGDYRRPAAVQGIHGEGHSARVNVWGQTKAMLHGISDSDIVETIGYFSRDHDLMRESDDHDPLHGEKAAERIRSTGGLMPARLVPTVAELVRWHVPEDYLAPDWNWLLAFIKDIDGLDRDREPGALDPTRLRDAVSRTLLLAPARLLSTLSMQYEHWYGMAPFDAVVAAASDMKITRW